MKKDSHSLLFNDIHPLLLEEWQNISRLPTKNGKQLTTITKHKIKGYFLQKILSVLGEQHVHMQVFGCNRRSKAITKITTKTPSVYTASLNCP